MKSKNIKVVIIVLAIMVIGIAVSVSSIDVLDLFKKDLREIGSSVKDIEKDDTNKNIALEIGDEIISMQSFKTVGIALKTEDENKITNYIIERMLIRNIAEQRGITVTDNEVKDYIKNLRDFIDNNEEAGNKFNIYLESFGYSPEEFWSSEGTFQQYKHALTEGKYRGLLREEFMKEHKSKSIDEIEKIVADEIKELIKIKKEKIRIVNHLL